MHGMGNKMNMTTTEQAVLRGIIADIEGRNSFVVTPEILKLYEGTWDAAMEDALIIYRLRHPERGINLT